MLIDSHAHIDDARFDADRDAVLERAAAADLELIINIGADMESWPAQSLWQKGTRKFMRPSVCIRMMPRK